MELLNETTHLTVITVGALLTVDRYKMFTIFRRFGLIHDIKIKYNHDIITYYEIQYVSITDKRFVDFTRGERKIDGNTFWFSVDGVQNNTKVLMTPTSDIGHTNNASIFSIDLRGKIHQFRDYCSKLWSGTSVVAAVDSPHNNLYAINDDCLLHIFNELSVEDLFKLAFVCERFNDIAKMAFKSRYRQKTFRMFDLLDKWRRSLYQTDLFLRTFGGGIRDIIVRFHSNNDCQLHMIDEYCPQLEALDLRVCVSINASTGDVIRRMLPRLKKFILDLPDQSVDDLLVGDWSLEKLGTTFNNLKTIIIKMPKLIDIRLNAPERFDRLTREHLNRTLSENPQIRRIMFYGYTISASDLDLLPNYMPSCNEMSFIDCNIDRNEATALTEWHKFKSLEALHIVCCVGFPTEQVLTSMAVHEVPLKRLSLRIPQINDNFVHQYITPLKQLETLTFSFPVSIDIHRLARSLDKLSEIIFDSFEIMANEFKEFIRRIEQPADLSIQFQTRNLNLIISGSDYDEIVDLLRARPQIKLRFETSDRDSFSDFL